MWPPAPVGRPIGSKDRSKRTRKQRSASDHTTPGSSTHAAGQEADARASETSKHLQAPLADPDLHFSSDSEDVSPTGAIRGESEVESEKVEPDSIGELLDQYLSELQDSVDLVEANVEEDLERGILTESGQAEAQDLQNEGPTVVEGTVPAPMPADDSEGQNAAGSAAPPAPALVADPVPAPVAVARAPRAQRAGPQRLGAVCVAAVPGGTISFYGVKEFFTATCGNKNHGRCVLTRSAVGGTRASQGRPLGLLTAWLSLSQAMETKAEHWDRSLWPDATLRRRKRHELSGLEGGNDLLAFERPLLADEASEPEDCP